MPGRLQVVVFFLLKWCCMFKELWFGFDSNAIDRPQWRICRNTARNSFSRVLWAHKICSSAAFSLATHFFLQRFAFGPWASPSCRIKLLNTPAGHWRCQRMRCSQLQWVCLYRGGIQRLLLSFVSLSVKWLMRMCVMWWFSFPSPDQMAERKGWLPGRQRPKIWAAKY